MKRGVDPASIPKNKEAPIPPGFKQASPFTSSNNDDVFKTIPYPQQDEYESQIHSLEEAKAEYERIIKQAKMIAEQVDQNTHNI